MAVGINLFLVSGYTGQTTQTFALPDEAAPFERFVGVRAPFYVSLSYTYRLHSKTGH